MCESMEMSMIARQAAQAVTELLEQANLQPGQILVVGCSSSEIVGGHIGKNSSMQAAAAVYSAIAPIVKQKKLYLAAQCCEHLNRAIILEAEAAEKYGYEPVSVCPWPHAGGSWATTCWQNFAARGGGGNSGARRVGHRRHADRNAFAPGGRAGAPFAGSYRQGAHSVCPHPSAPDRR